jgi:integrin beta 3
LTGGVQRIRVARSVVRRQMREQQRVRTLALVTIVLLVLGAPMLYFGILTATRDPVLNSLDRLPVPAQYAQSPEDRIIGGSRWCFIDCRFRERRLVSQADTEETTDVYRSALREAGWREWQVEGCPGVQVDGDYSCWTRDEYTLDLWVHPPECAYDPLILRPELDEDDESGGAREECTGSVVEIKMQNRVADERGQPAVVPDGNLPPDGSPPPDPAATPPPEEPSETAETS